MTKATKAERAAFKADPSLAVVAKHVADDRYAQLFYSGPTARLTMPLLDVDHIKSAAIVLGKLAGELELISTRRRGSTFTKVLAARGAVSQAGRELKGGVSFRGAR